MLYANIGVLLNHIYMKSKIIPNISESEQPLKYPILMEHPHYKYVVLFYSEQAGMVVHEGIKNSQEKPIHNLGHYYHAWRSATDAGSWRKFEGIIELSN